MLISLPIFEKACN